MILILKNVLTNEQEEYRLDDWEDVAKIAEKFPYLLRKVEQASNFEKAKEELLRYFNSTTYFYTKILKDKPLVKAQLVKSQITATDPVDFALKFDTWMKQRAKQSRDESAPIPSENQPKPKVDIEKPGFIERLKGMFGL